MQNYIDMGCSLYVGYLENTGKIKNKAIKTRFKASFYLYVYKYIHFLIFLIFKINDKNAII